MHNKRTAKGKRPKAKGVGQGYALRKTCVAVA